MNSNLNTQIWMNKKALIEPDNSHMHSPVIFQPSSRPA